MAATGCKGCRSWRLGATAPAVFGCDGCRGFSSPGGKDGCHCHCRAGQCLQEAESGLRDLAAESNNPYCIPSLVEPPSETAGAARGPGAITEQLRCQKAWLDYTAFLAAPGGKCPDCWLLRRFCCCSGFQPVALRPQVALLMHHVELSQRRSSNTAKLLLSFGAELFAWGLPEHDQRLRELLLADEAEGVCTAVLFPSEGSVPAEDLALAPPSRVLVLDGGWRETGHMNASLPASLVRCRVTTARRSDYGGTRKYGNGNDGEGRVQTAAAFITLLQELGEDPAHVAELRAGLAHFMTCFEAQIHRSKT